MLVWDMEGSKCLEIYALLNFKLLRQADENSVKNLLTGSFL